MRGVFDIEANGLLDHTSINYTVAPFKLKPTFRVWCGVITDIDTGVTYRFAGEDEMRNGFIPLFLKLTTVIGHNIIDYDLLVLKLYFDIDYEIADQCTINGKPVEVVDTLVWSKTLNPDRYGGHSLDEWGKRLGLEKIDWRQRAIDLGLIAWNAPKGAEFQQYHPEMLVYNERDVGVNVKLYWHLIEEAGNWDWKDALTLEHCTRDIVTRQSHRGFWFDATMAEANVRELDEKMEVIRQTVEPLLPPKPMGVTKLKAYLPPKIQFLKNGSLSSHMLKFIEKHGGRWTQGEDGKYSVSFYGEAKVWTLPMAGDAPIKTHEPATVKDTTHIKGWLVELGWRPTQYKERDLTCDSKKKKLSPEKFAETVQRYVEQTIESPFCRDRCSELDTKPSKLLEKLLKHDLKRPLKVYTNPTITVGMEKEIDPALLELADKFPHAKLVSEYLTYAHRRNSILGGGVDPDELEDDDEFAGKGFLASERISDDHRIPTPADTCGAGTSRFKHRLVANIPRVTSLYGKNMRALFGVDVADGFIQMGYDFDSLEAKIEAHYVYKYPGGPEYGVSLTAEKPNDCHCFDSETEVLTAEGWKTFGNLSDSDVVAQFWPDSGKAEFVKPMSIVWEPYHGNMIHTKSSKIDQLVTPLHRVLYKTFRDSRWKVSRAGSVLSETYAARIPTQLSLVGGISESVDYLNVLVAVQADGYFSKDCSAITLGLVKSRKVESITASLSSIGQTYSVSHYERNGRTEFTVRIHSGSLALRLREELTESKSLPWSLLKLSEDCRKYLVNAIGVWDGTTKASGDIVLDTRCKQSTEVLQALAVSIGLRATLSSFYRKTNFGSGTLHRCYVSRASQMANMTAANTSMVPYDGFIGCVTVPSSYIVVRRNGKVSVSGNSVLAAEISEIIGREFPRSTAKSVKYACSYNAQPPRVAKTIGCSLQDAQLVFDTFWTQASPLKELKERMQKYWETTGQKKFLLGIDGRKLPIRSKGNVINTAFQSAGVICAKRAMVLHECKLKAEGMYVDFFRDNWKEKEFCQQLIAYHDEAQCEVKMSLVAFKTFKFGDDPDAAKAAAAAYKAQQEAETGKRWSDVMKGPKGYFVGYCRAGEMATEAVREAGVYYKLNVELSAGYCLGRNWAETH